MKKWWLYGNIPEGSQIHISPPKRTPGSQNGSQNFNRKIAKPQNEPWARLGFPAAQKFKPACKNERKNYIGPKEANDSESTYIRTARRNGNPNLYHNKRALRPARRARNFHTGYIYGILNAFENRAVARRLI